MDSQNDKETLRMSLQPSRMPPRDHIDVLFSSRIPSTLEVDPHWYKTSQFYQLFRRGQFPVDALHVHAAQITDERCDSPRDYRQVNRSKLELQTKDSEEESPMKLVTFRPYQLPWLQGVG